MIQIHSPHVKIDEERIRQITQRALEHHESKLTRVDVYLSDVNAGKGGVDKHCVMEARLRGLDPVAVEHDSESPADAVAGASKKLSRRLETKLGKLGDSR